MTNNTETYALRKALHRSRRDDGTLDAAQHLDAVEISEDTWVYVPDEVSTAYTVTSQDLADLGRDLRIGQPDAYSLWCSMCGDESTKDEIREWSRLYDTVSQSFREDV